MAITPGGHRRRNNGYSIQEIEKIGNALIYLSNGIKGLNKTMALKLIYLLDEFSIKKFGIPIFGLEYEVWQFGPVAQDLYIEFSERPEIFGEYIDTEFNVDFETTYILSKKKFDDGEFNQSEIDLLDLVIEKLGHLNAKDLSKMTHSPERLWYKTAKENNLLDKFDNLKTRSSNCKIDFERILDDSKKEIYQDYLAFRSTSRFYNV